MYYYKKSNHNNYQHNKKIQDSMSNSFPTDPTDQNETHESTISDDAMLPKKSTLTISHGVSAPKESIHPAIHRSISTNKIPPRPLAPKSPRSAIAQTRLTTPPRPLVPTRPVITNSHQGIKSLIHPTITTSMHDIKSLIQPANATISQRVKALTNPSAAAVSQGIKTPVSRVKAIETKGKTAPIRPALSAEKKNHNPTIHPTNENVSKNADAVIRPIIPSLNSNKKTTKIGIYNNQWWMDYDEHLSQILKNDNSE